MKDKLMKRIEKGKGLPPIGKAEKQIVICVGRGDGKSFIINLIQEHYKRTGDWTKAVKSAAKELEGVKIEECKRRNPALDVKPNKLPIADSPKHTLPEAVRLMIEEADRAKEVANKATIPSHEFAKRLKAFAFRS